MLAGMTSLRLDASFLRKNRALTAFGAAVVAAALAAGCSTAGSGTGSATATGSGSTGAGSAGTTTTTSGATSAGTGGATGTGGTSSTTGGSTGGTGAGSSGTTSGSGGSTGGGGALPQCQTAADCKIVDDCCTCAAWPGNQDAPACPIQDCTITACEAAEYKAEPVCEAGLCRFPKTTCDPTEVVCLAPSPACDEGFLPEVEGQCWSGACVPASACDWAPSCEACQPWDVCVATQTQLGPVYRCEPKPWECGEGAADCDCAGQLCQDPYDTCNPGQGASIECSCPDC